MITYSREGPPLHQPWLGDLHKHIKGVVQATIQPGLATCGLTQLAKLAQNYVLTLGYQRFDCQAGIERSVKKPLLLELAPQ